MDITVGSSKPEGAVAQFESIFLVPIEKNEQFLVPKEYKKLIHGIDLTTERNELPIKKASLKKILEFCEHFINSEIPQVVKPLQFNNFKDCINDEWLYNYISKFTIKECFEMANDCFNLKCDTLFGFFCAKLGHYFRCESLEKLGEEFDLITYEFTYEEEKELLKINPWIENLAK